METDQKTENSTPVVKIEENADGKHKLETGWTLWFDKKPKDKKTRYEDNLVQVGTFHTIEDFFNLYTHLKRPIDMPKESNYHLFREGVKPMWESFPKGGCWIKKVKKSEEELLGRMWEELLFATIGEAFEDPDVVGVVLSIRQKEDALSIWNKDNSNHSLRNNIGEKLKDIWNLDPNTPMEYKNHVTSMRDRSTYRNGKQFYV